MARGPSTFRQRDLKAAVKAVVAAGCPVVRAEVDRDGKIIVVTAEAQKPEQVDEFEKWRAKHARRT